LLFLLLLNLHKLVEQSAGQTGVAWKNPRKSNGFNEQEPGARFVKRLRDLLRRLKLHRQLMRLTAMHALSPATAMASMGEEFCIRPC